MAQLFVGLMSGTSLDGVDALLANLAPASGTTLEVISYCHCPFDESLRAELLALNTSAPDELHRGALAANAVSRAYAWAVRELMRQSGRSIRDVRAIGAHGQTVRHRPSEFDGTGYTVQLLNGALLAELCHADVVCDLRSRDVAASGQGAPLVPPFHAALFARPGAAQAVLNLGGIANLTLLGTEGSVRGFDCGPGNVLLDLWCQQHLGRTFDDLGAWAASGQVRHDLLSALEADPYFSLAPPKSTGRDRFNAAWLDRSLAAVPGLAPADVQATLAELTARRAASDLRTYLPDATRLLVCGGGALNSDLMRRLQALLAGVKVASTADEGLPPTTVEAAAFAWLAQAFVERRPANHPAVTGATGFRVLGALYPAH